MKRTIIALTLILALVLGGAAFAEPVEARNPEPVEVEAQAPAEDEAPAEPEEAPEEDGEDSLREALDALREARHAAQQEALKEELDGYVAAGTLTQAQADLILNAFAEGKGFGRSRAEGRDGGRQSRMPGRSGCQNGGCRDNGQNPCVPGQNGRQNGGRTPRQGGARMPRMPQMPGR